LALPGEAYLSHRLKKEGKLRRLQSRKPSVAGGTKQDARHSLTSSEAGTRHIQDSRQAYPDGYTTSLRRPRKQLTLSIQSTDRVLPISPLSEQSHSPSSQTDLYSPLSPLSRRSESPLLPRPPSNSVSLSSDLPPTVTLVAVNDGPRPPTYPVKGYHDGNSEPENSQADHLLPSTTTTDVHLRELRSARFSTLTEGDRDSRLAFEMDEREATDVDAVSEHARPGKPKLDKLIADEVQASKGAIVVACQLIPPLSPGGEADNACLARLRTHVSECVGTQARRRANRSWADT